MCCYSSTAELCVAGRNVWVVVMLADVVVCWNSRNLVFLLSMYCCAKLLPRDSRYTLVLQCIASYHVRVSCDRQAVPCRGPMGRVHVIPYDIIISCHITDKRCSVVALLCRLHVFLGVSQCAHCLQQRRNSLRALPGRRDQR